MKKNFTLFYKILIVIVSSIALYLNFKIMPFKEGILYFTIQSNLLCFFYYIVIVILKLLKKEKKNNVYYITKGMITMAIAVTMIVFQMIVLPTDIGVYENHLFECYLVHIIVPLLVIFDYIIFGEKGNLKKSYPFVWSLVLVAYLIFSVIYIYNGGLFFGGDKYPYTFLDIDKYGIGNVAINCIVVYVIFIGSGLFICFLDKKIKEETVKMKI